MLMDMLRDLGIYEERFGKMFKDMLRDVGIC